MSEGVSKELLLRRRNLGAPHTTTATGAIATFAGNMVAPLKECKCEFTPVQSGTGDPSPSNVRPISGWTGANISRTGKNLIDQSFFADVDNYTVSGSYGYSYTEYLPFPAGTQITIKFSGDDSGIQTCNMNICGQAIVNDGKFATKTTTVPASGIRAGINKGDYATKQDALDAIFAHGNLQIELGSPATAYAAYVGNTYPVQFPATKNLLNESTLPPLDNPNVMKYVSVYVGNGTFTASSNIPAGTYADIFFIAGIATGGASTSTNGVWNGQARTQTAEDGYVTIAYRNSALDYHIQIEAGTTATPYEPYGTIYGGYIDPVRGVAVATWGMVYGGSLGWSAATSSGKRVFYTTITSQTPSVAEAICDRYKTKTAVPYDNKSGIAYALEGLRYGIRDDDYAEATATEFKEAVANMQIAYRLPTSIEYPLTPQLIKSLKGQNNVFSDLNGNTTVQYWKH